MHSEVSPRPGSRRRRVGLMGADTTAIKKQIERNSMNMTTTVLGKDRLRNGDRC